MSMPKDIISFGFLTESAVPVWYLKAGKTIFKEGDPATELYAIESGQVEIQQGNRPFDTLEENENFR